MNQLFTLLAIVVVGLVAAVAADRIHGGLPEPTGSVPDPELPEGPLSAADLERVRFAPAVRGYRMEQVDALLDRLAGELARRDALLAEPEPAAAPTGQGDPDDPTGQGDPAVPAAAVLDVPPPPEFPDAGPPIADAAEPAAQAVALAAVEPADTADRGDLAAPPPPDPAPDTGPGSERPGHPAG